MEVFDGVGWIGGLETYRITSPTVTADTSSRPGWAVLTFTGPGSIDVTGSGSAEVLVVAGGGGGGYVYGGGGGAGGFRTATLSLTAGPYPITVGGGGAGGVTPSTSGRGSSGGDSIFSTITSSGGGGGACSQTSGSSDVGQSAGDGGSGGGGSHWTSSLPNPAPYAAGSGNTPATSPPQGNPGGDGAHSAYAEASG